MQNRSAPSEHFSAKTPNEAISWQERLRGKDKSSLLWGILDGERTTNGPYCVKAELYGGVGAIPPR